MALPPLEDGTSAEATELTILRYIYDVLQGAGNVAGSYNTLVATKKAASGVHTMAAGTAHSVVITAETQDVTVGIGSSTCKVLAGQSIKLEATGLFNVAITITAGSGGSAHIYETRP